MAKLLDKLPKLDPDFHYEAVDGIDLDGDEVIYVQVLDPEGNFVRFLDRKEMAAVIHKINKMLGL